MRPQVIIWATIALNGALFIVNLVIAVQSGSRAVLSQAVYTITDLVGSGLLLWGFVVSQRPPSYDHPFGFGKERFFWSFSASLVTFTIAGLLVLTTGLDQVLNPQPVTHLEAGLAVVGLTIASSFAGILVTLRELRHSRETLQTLLESTHQGLKTIFYQDVVSIFGSIVAFAGILIVYRTGDAVADGAAASAVGVLLIVTGLVLAAESRELLVGKAIPPRLAREILSVIERNPHVRRVREVQSMMLGPDDVLIALRVNFQDGLTVDELEMAIDEIGHAVKSAFPTVRHLVIEPES
jgi:cation diffusion facilitator family transporter